ncbi:hypothetical protein GcM3_192041 [Golovinomyces cichoracearum]|uniref:Uncharacterized protein n=1 Tax=Golovinomyces cichoracearum TaxID=62708 RepID=A0A420HHG2_9PEZI|nr:hypothetical protein GcM3_192041 [Golovinomyces cichoracearum]
MQGIVFGFEANENSRKRTRIDCESDGDENVQETQIIDNKVDRVFGAGQAENSNSGVNAAATFRPVRRKSYTSIAGLVLGMGVAYDDKAFRFPAKLLIYDNEHPKGVDIGLKAQHVMADQGSDTNVIANWLVEKLSFDRRPLADKIAIVTADGNTAFYREYASIQIGVGGI